jgi:hypothetical protein
MRVYLERLTLIACLVFVCTGAPGAQSSSESLVQELFLKSGLDHLIEQIQDLFVSGIDKAIESDPRLKGLPRHARQGILKAAADAFAAPKTRAVMLKSVAGKLDAAEIKALLEWLESPIGKKCTDLEKESITPERMKTKAAFLQGLQKNPPPVSRLKLIFDLERATNATATAVQMYISTHLAVATAMSLSLSQENRKPLDQIQKELDDQRAEIEKSMQEQTLVGMLFTYHPISDAELRKYVEFVESPVGNKYCQVTSGAFNQAIVSAGADFGQAAAKVFEGLSEKSET